MSGELSAIEGLYDEVGWRRPEPEQEFWVARRSGTPIAVATVMEGPNDFVYLDALIVASRERGSGVGSCLLERVLTSRTVPWWLECAGRNISFYERFGFSIADDDQIPDWVWSRCVLVLDRPKTFMSRS